MTVGAMGLFRESVGIALVIITLRSNGFNRRGTAEISGLYSITLILLPPIIRMFLLFGLIDFLVIKGLFCCVF
jgi:hypothetical protein